MKKIMRVFLAALCFLMLFNFSSAAEEKTWQDVFFLKDGGRDMDRLLYAIGSEDSLVQKDMKRVLKEENAVVDYSKAYIYYTFSLEGLSKYYLEGNTNLGYDSLPDVCYRQIHLPIFRNGDIIGQFKFGDFTPYDERPDIHPTTTPNDIGGYLWMEYDGAYMNITYADSWEYAEMGYDVVSAMGADIQAIFCLGSHRVVLKTDEEIYVYPAYNIEEPEKGNQAMPLEEFVRASDMGQIAVEPVFVTPEPTPAPTPTPPPRPSRTRAATLSRTVVTPTATPGAGRTATPVLTATASLLPSSSSAPEQSAGSAVLIVMGAIFACVVIGSAVFVAVRKKKAGK